MTTYLVDFENVKSDGLNGIADLKVEDKVIIFYSINADKITFSLHKRMNESLAKINYMKVEVGHKNALDFQLVTYLGYLLAKDEKEEYVIVSNDNGYNNVITFWKKKNYKVMLVADLTKQNMLEKQNELLVSVKQYIEDDEEAKLVTDYILKYKTKQGLNNAIVKIYGTTKGGKLYKAIKPLIQDKKGK